jgi:hypothetical protein
MKTLEANSIRIGKAYGEMKVGMDVLSAPKIQQSSAVGSRNTHAAGLVPVDKFRRHGGVTEPA